MSHYYKLDEQLHSHPFEITFKFKGSIFTFLSDSGVFSKSSVDFGTQFMLEHIQLDKVTHILDMGCGYGVSGIVLSQVYQSSKLSMFDINPRAVALTKHNVERYHLKGADISVSDGVPSHINHVDLAVLNPPIRAGKETVFRLYDQAYDVLVTNGSLFVVIQKKQGAPSTLKYLSSKFKIVNLIAKNKGYYLYQAIKY